MRLFWYGVLIHVLGDLLPSDGGDTTPGRENSRKIKMSSTTLPDHSLPLKLTTPHPHSGTPMALVKYNEQNRWCSSFRRHFELRRPYVDKTEFISEILNYRGASKAIAISRPSQSGRTLNLDMLADFCDINTDNKDLFDDTWKIMQKKHETLRSTYMNQYPVIFMEFLTMSFGTTMDTANQMFHETVGEVYRKFHYLENSERISESMKADYKIITQTHGYGVYDYLSIAKLCKMLRNHHGKDPILIFDDVDLPLANAVSHGFLKNMTSLMTRFLKISLEENLVYKKAVILSIVPLQDYIPSNVDVLTIEHPKFDASFGFVKEEVEQLLTEAGQRRLMPTITKWYKHFRIGGLDIYNPRSVIECQAKNWVVERHARPTGPLESLISYLLSNTGMLPILNLQVLTTDEVLKKRLDEVFGFYNLFESESTLWALFFHSGVITVTDKVQSSKDPRVFYVRLPGEDIKRMLQESFMDPIYTQPDYSQFVHFVNDGNLDAVQRYLTTYIDGAGCYLDACKTNESSLREKLTEYIETLIQKWMPRDEEQRKNHIVRVEDDVLIQFYGRVSNKPVLWTIYIRRIRSKENKETNGTTRDSGSLEDEKNQFAILNQAAKASGRHVFEKVTE